MADKLFAAKLARDEHNKQINVRDEMVTSISERKQSPGVTGFVINCHISSAHVSLFALGVCEFNWQERVHNRARVYLPQDEY